jgi:hypothetical protein
MLVAGNSCKLGARNEVSLVTNHEFSTCIILCEGNTIYWTKLPQVLQYYLHGEESLDLAPGFSKYVLDVTSVNAHT